MPYVLKMVFKVLAVVQTSTKQSCYNSYTFFPLRLALVPFVSSSCNWNIVIFNSSNSLPLFL